MTQRLAGRIAVVTGGGRGFGQAIALHLAAQSAQVAVISRNRAELAHTVSMIEDAGGVAMAFAADVTDPEAVAQAAKAVHDHFGDPSLLVNCAGVGGPYGPVGIVDPHAWWQAMTLHIRAPFLMMDALLPAMRREGKGTVINLTSLAGTRIIPHLSAYALGKATLTRLSETVAEETRADGIAVFSIEPGTMRTALMAETLESLDARRWLPGLVNRIEHAGDAVDGALTMVRCGERCVQLATGTYDALSGRYLVPEDDLDALCAERHALA